MAINIEQQFVRFETSIPTTPAEIALPVCDGIPFGAYINIDDYRATGKSFQIDLVRANGDLIKESITSNYGLDNVQFSDMPWYFVLDGRSLAEYLAPNECFRLNAKIGNNSGSYVENILLNVYSTLFRYTPNDNNYLSSIQYFCDEPEFDIPFFTIPRQGSKAYVQLALPIRLKNPQFKQSDKIYETRNGEQIVLYSTINKEYDGETDYIPESWHERIVTALACDEVLINGERVTKSDSYEIDHDNYTYSDGGIRLTKATFKVKTNVTQRNSNC